MIFKCFDFFSRQLVKWSKLETYCRCNQISDLWPGFYTVHNFWTKMHLEKIKTIGHLRYLIGRYWPLLKQYSKRSTKNWKMNTALWSTNAAAKRLVRWRRIQRFESFRASWQYHLEPSGFCLMHFLHGLSQDLLLLVTIFASWSEQRVVTRKFMGHEFIQFKANSHTHQMTTVLPFTI